MSSHDISLEEFFRINLEKKLLINVPEADDTELTSGTRLLEVRRQTQEIDQGLAFQKEEFSLKMENIEQRRIELMKKKENDAKRQRALKKATDEEKQRQLKEVELSTLKELSAHVIERKDISDQIKNRGTIEQTQDYDEIKDLLARYETLITTYNDLLLRSQEAQESIEKERSRLLHLLEAKNDTILSHNNELSRLHDILEIAQRKTVMMEHEIDKKTKESTQRTLILGK
ncbi:hypothetical protein ROZALSC1DRAFT_26765, partial [Rozella allomycis CSF55]